MVSGFASHVRFTTDHEWVLYEDEESEMTLGITEFAQQALGDVVFVDLPAVGAEFKAGATVAAVESVKAASDVYLPLGGRVTRVNALLADQPNLVNSHPRGEGYFLKFIAANPSDFTKLLDETEYSRLVESLKKD